jgi:hypothetical protein
MVSASVQFVSLNSLLYSVCMLVLGCKFSTYYYSVIACYLCYIFAVFGGPRNISHIKFFPYASVSIRRYYSGQIFVARISLRRIFLI